MVADNSNLPPQASPPSERPTQRPIMALPANSIPLDHYELKDLIILKARVEKRLPTLQSLDLQQELVLQFAETKALLTEASKAPLNQKSQVINTASSILKQLAEMQIKLYSADRNKALELCLIDLLKEADEEDREAFMEEYEKRLSLIDD